jgi:hypothetical protein
MYVAPAVAVKYSEDCWPQPSSLQAICVPGVGQPVVAYTAITVSENVPPQIEKFTDSVAAAVHSNQTSRWTVGHPLGCCGLSVAPLVLTEKLPVPAITVAVVQLFEPWALADDDNRHSAETTETGIRERCMAGSRGEEGCELVR